MSSHSPGYYLGIVKDDIYAVFPCRAVLRSRGEKEPREALFAARTPVYSDTIPTPARFVVSGWVMPLSVGELLDMIADADAWSSAPQDLDTVELDPL